MSRRIILLITGQPGAGKTEVSRHLVNEFGFTSVLVSDLIREYARPKGITLRERGDFKAAQTQLLAELGQFAIPDSILDMPSDFICVDGIRVPAHAERLRTFGSKIIALNCPPEVRFERAFQRKDGLDKTIYEDFIHDEEQEDRNPDPFVQSTLTVMEMADYHIDSSRPLAQVFKSVDEVVVPLIDRLRSDTL